MDRGRLSRCGRPPSLPSPKPGGSGGPPCLACGMGGGGGGGAGACTLRWSQGPSQVQGGEGGRRGALRFRWARRLRESLALFPRVMVGGRGGRNSRGTRIARDKEGARAVAPHGRGIPGWGQGATRALAPAKGRQCRPRTPRTHCVRRPRARENTAIGPSNRCVWLRTTTRVPAGSAYAPQQCVEKRISARAAPGPHIRR